jgi:metallophosphoesterase (TIGR00282 family)
MNILFVGDIVGHAGRDAVLGLLPDLKAERADFVIANGENMAGGLGITPALADELLAAGVDVITTGNHVFRRKEIVPYLDGQKRILRPANYPGRTPGRGWGVFDAPGGGRVAVVNLLGQLFMEGASDPVECLDELLAGAVGACPVVIVDFHAEATGEKAALFKYLDGRVSALLGTHTHVQTADETVSEVGTAFISDVGMTGPVHSVIGLDPAVVIKRMRTNVPQSFRPAGGDARLDAVIMGVDDRTGRAASIERLRLPWRRVEP